MRALYRLLDYDPAINIEVWSEAHKRMDDFLVGDTSTINLATNRILSELSNEIEEIPSSPRDDIEVESRSYPSRLFTILERLTTVMVEDYIPIWLASPLAMLDGERPLDLIDRGEDDRLSAIVAGLESPGAA